MSNQKTRPSVAERVTSGAQWLAEHGAEYGFDVTRIDPATLVMSDTTACVLAQVNTVPNQWGSSGFWAALDHVFPGNYMSEEAMAWAADHGFLAYADGRDGGDDDPSIMEEYQALAEQWRAVLA